MDKSIKRGPLVAVLDGRPGALSPRAPHAAYGGLEPAAVLVGRPQLYGVLQSGVLERLEGRWEVCLKAVWAVRSALAWPGRGTFEVPPKRHGISQPGWGCARRPSVAAIQAAALGPVHTPPSGGG